MGKGGGGVVGRRVGGGVNFYLDACIHVLSFRIASVGGIKAKIPEIRGPLGKEGRETIPKKRLRQPGSAWGFGRDGRSR